MKGLSRYLLRQHLGPFALATLALTGVVWLSQSLRIVDLIISRGLSPGTFLAMSLLIVPRVVEIVLPIGFFAASLIVLSRLIAEREFVAILAAGVSRWRVAVPILVLASAVTLLTYGLTVYLTPHGQRALKSMIFENQGDFAAILLQPGRFNTLGQGLTVYVRERGKDGRLDGLLVHDNREPSAPMTLLADKALLLRSANGPRLVLMNGTRQDLDRDRSRLTRLGFTSHTLDLAPYMAPDAVSKTTTPTPRFKPNEFYLDELFEAGNAGAFPPSRLAAEFHRRLSAPLHVLAFCLIALATLLRAPPAAHELGRRVGVGVAIAVVVRGAGLWADNLAAKLPEVIPVLYLIPLAVIAAALYLLVLHGARSPSGGLAT